MSENMKLRMLYLKVYINNNETRQKILINYANYIIKKSYDSNISRNELY